MGLYSEVESIKYETDFKRLAEKRGMSEEDIDLLLLKGGDDDFSEAIDFEGFPGEDIGKSKQEMDFALMRDEESIISCSKKVKNFPDCLNSTSTNLPKTKNSKKSRNSIVNSAEKYPDFMYLHFLMGAIHISIDPALAKSCFERTLEMAEKDEDVPETILESLQARISLHWKNNFKKKSEKQKKRISSEKKASVKE